MIKVGLTGGIGSGKTFVANIFFSLGIPVFNADIEAKKLYDTDNNLLLQLRKHFGNNIFDNNTLNKKKLAAIVFANHQALATLNSLVHPLLLEYFNQWVSLQTAPYVIQEAAILFESGFNRYMDKVIAISAPKEIRIQRVTQRDRLSDTEVLNRMQHQLHDNTLTSQSDFTIINDGQTALLPQVLAVHNQLLSLG